MKKIIFITILFLGCVSAFAAANTTQPLPPQITICPKNYLAGEEMLYLEGVAPKDAKVAIYLKYGGQLIKKWQLRSNQDGHWFLAIDELFKSGNYSLEAEAENKTSSPCQLKIKFNGFALGIFLISLKNLTLALSIILLTLLAFAVFFFVRKKISQKKLNKEVKEAKNMLDSAFKNLDKQIKKRIELFDSQAGFNTAERQVYNDLKKYLDTAKNSIEKEIKDIENHLK